MRGPRPLNVNTIFVKYMKMAIQIQKDQNVEQNASTKSFDVVITKCLEVWCLGIRDNTHVGHNN